MVLIKIQNWTFEVDAAILANGSDFFSKHVNVEEGKNQVIVFQDIKPCDFDLYNKIAHRFARNPQYEFSEAPPCYPGRKKVIRFRTERLLRLWQLACRFQTPALCDITARAITKQFERFSAAKWRKIADWKEAREFRPLFREMQASYGICKSDFVPSSDKCVGALANAPAAVFAACVGELEGDFKLKARKAHVVRRKRGVTRFVDRVVKRLVNRVVTRVHGRCQESLGRESVKVVQVVCADA